MQHSNDTWAVKVSGFLLLYASRAGGVRRLVGSLWSVSDSHRSADEHSPGGPADSPSSHLLSSRVRLYVPKEEPPPIPLKKIDVTRSSHANLDVVQEKHTNDYWNVDVDRTFSVSWTKFTLLNEKPPPGFLWPGGRLTKIQATTRPDFLLPQMWIGCWKQQNSKYGPLRSQSSTIFEDWGICTSSIPKTISIKKPF